MRLRESAASAGVAVAVLAGTATAAYASPAADALLDFVASGDEGHIDTSASSSAGAVGFDPEDPSTWGSGIAAGVADEPYPWADGDPTRFTPVCDAIDGCPEAMEELAESEEVTRAEVEAAIQQAYQSLPVAPSPISYQPDGDWAAVNMDFIVYTDTTEQVLDTTILDIPVTFRLNPSHWTWDFGDGSAALPSSNPGAPYPNQTISHVYSSATEGVTITLTTLWSGQFQIAGTGNWYPVDGFVTTTATAGPVEIVAFDVHLVPNQG